MNMYKLGTPKISCILSRHSDEICIVVILLVLGLAIIPYARGAPDDSTTTASETGTAPSAPPTQTSAIIVDSTQ